MAVVEEAEHLLSSDDQIRPVIKDFAKFLPAVTKVVSPGHSLIPVGRVARVQTDVTGLTRDGRRWMIKLFNRRYVGDYQCDVSVP